MIITWDSDNQLYQDPITKFVFIPSEIITILGFGDPTTKTIRGLTKKKLQ